jgi:tetratricopeptide (TPR) repeat protein
MPAAINLFGRATTMLPEKAHERLELLPHFAFALLETGEFDRMQTVVAEASELAAESGDLALQAHALTLGLWMRFFTNPEGWAQEAEQEAMGAISLFEELGDEHGLAKGWALLGQAQLYKAQFKPGEEAWEKAAAHAHRAGDYRDEMESLSWVALCVWAGPTPAERGLLRCRELFERAQQDKKAMSTALFVQAEFEAGMGRSEEAREHIARAKALLQEVAATVWMAGPLAQFTGLVELWAGDPIAAERELRWGYETLSEIGEMGWLPTVVDILAESLHVQGRYEDAEALTKTSEETAGTEDLYSQVLRRAVLAKVWARSDRLEEAERVARESVAISEKTDFVQLRARALMALGEVLQLGGRPAESRTAFEEARRLFDMKGYAMGARRAEDLLEELK